MTDNEKQEASKAVAAKATLLDIRLKGIEADITDFPSDGEQEFETKHAVKYLQPEARKFLLLPELSVVLRRAGQGGEWAKIHIVLLATYETTVDVSAPEIAAFAAINGIYNAWPFFRELVQSTTARMGVAPLTLPLFRVSSNVAVPPKRPRNAKPGK